MDPGANCLRHTQKFPTRQAAQAALNAWKAKADLNGTPQVFKCPVWPRHYHIGRRPRKGAKR